MLESLPSWERGLKVDKGIPLYSSSHVAPLVGAWIEIVNHCYVASCHKSLPSWERGLKLDRLSITDTVDPRRSPRGSVD